MEEYGLNDECDPYGHNLCVKVAAEGGANCEYFVEIAALSGWVIDCHDTSRDPEPIAGCFEIGCTPLGPTPVYNPTGSDVGLEDVCACSYGEVSKHPDTGRWENGKTSGAICEVPGSNLGWGPDADESCCFIVGYYSFNDPSNAVDRDYCRDEGNTITFDCPDSAMDRTHYCAPLPRRLRFDDTGNYTDWGNAFVWEVTVIMSESQALQSGLSLPTPDETYSAAGQFMVGNIPLSVGSQIGGSPLCSDIPSSTVASFALCFLERIKPAHTVMNYKVIQP